MKRLRRKSVQKRKVNLNIYNYKINDGTLKPRMHNNQHVTVDETCSCFSIRASFSMARSTCCWLRNPSASYARDKLLNEQLPMVLHS